MVTHLDSIRAAEGNKSVERCGITDFQSSSDRDSTELPIRRPTQLSTPCTQHLRKVHPRS